MTRRQGFRVRSLWQHRGVLGGMAASCSGIRNLLFNGITTDLVQIPAVIPENFHRVVHFDSRPRSKRFVTIAHGSLATIGSAPVAFL